MGLAVNDIPLNHQLVVLAHVHAIPCHRLISPVRFLQITRGTWSCSVLESDYEPSTNHVHFRRWAISFSDPVGHWPVPSLAQLFHAGPCRAPPIFYGIMVRMNGGFRGQGAPSHPSTNKNHPLLAWANPRVSSWKPPISPKLLGPG